MTELEEAPDLSYLQSIYRTQRLWSQMHLSIE